MEESVCVCVCVCDGHTPSADTHMHYTCTRPLYTQGQGSLTSGTDGHLESTLSCHPREPDIRVHWFQPSVGPHTVGTHHNRVEHNVLFTHDATKKSLTSLS